MNKPKKLKIGLVQMKVTDDISVNMEKTVKAIETAAKKGAKIVCLQELFRTRYFPQEKNDKSAKNLAETTHGETTKELSKIAKKLGIVIIAPIFEKTLEGKYFNSAVVINEKGKLLKTYRKNHIPFDELFWEKNYFEEGNFGYQVYKTRFANFSVLICYDQWFPEAARICAMKGAEIIFYPTAIGNIKNYKAPEGDWHEAWETIQRSHAIANGIHVAAVNRVGKEGKLKFWGSSFVSDSFGKVLKRASSEKEEILVVEIDLSKNKLVQEGWEFFKNRRPDTYQQISKMTNL